MSVSALNRSSTSPRRDGGVSPIRRSSPNRTRQSRGGSEYSGALQPATDMSSGVVRGTDLRSLLLTTEREAAALREECAVRGSEVDTLKTTLQREHETNLRLHTRHDAELDEMREEYGRQQSQLIEQITVLKGLCDSALADKQRVQEEAARSKASLLGLIEKERDEKSEVMAEYRQQTETLIADQGREITGLRHLLELAREEEEKLLATIASNDNRRGELEGTIAQGEATLSDERLASQKRLRELEHRHAQQLQVEREKVEAGEASRRKEVARLSALKDAADDQVRSLTERLRICEHQHEQERARLKESYRTDLANAAEELRALRDRSEKADSAHKREMSKLQDQEENVTAALRKTIETLRQEKSTASDEARDAKELLLGEHQNRLQQLHGTVDGLQKDLQDERVARKDADARCKSALVTNEGLQANVTRLSTELEQQQVEFRTKLREVEQAFRHQLDEAAEELRDSESDNALLRHQLKKVDLELQRLLDEVDAKQEALDAVRSERLKERERSREEATKLQLTFDDYRRQSTKGMDVLQAQKIQLETEVGRLQRLMGETESRLSSANKHLIEERTALERSVSDNHQLKMDNGELRSAVDRMSKQLAEASAAGSEKQETLDKQNKLLADMDATVQAHKELLEGEREEKKRRARDYEDQISELRAAARLQMEKCEAELHGTKENLRHARDATKDMEMQIRQQREEVARWQRECVAKDEVHGDALRTMREQGEDELGRMDDIINSLREELAKVQGGRSLAQREVADAARDADRRVAIVQDALDAERASKHRLHEELRNREQMVAELNGTLRLLNNRMTSKDDEIQRLSSEVEEYTHKMHDAHSNIGRKDAVIGQLNARVRVLEHSSHSFSSGK